MNVTAPGPTTALSLFGVTATDGSVTFGVRSMAQGIYTVRVSDVTHTSLDYDPAANVETEHSLVVP